MLFNGITKGEKRGIVIGCSTDKEGNPAYSRFLITVIVHELLHHYTNPCLAQYWSQIDSASQIIYPHVKRKDGQTGLWKYQFNYDRMV